MKKLLGAAVAAVGLAVAGSSSAAVQIYTSLPDYEAASGPSDFYNFDRFMPVDYLGDGIGLPNPLNYASVAFSSTSFLGVYQDCLCSSRYLDTGRSPLTLGINGWNSFALNYGSYYGASGIKITVNGEVFDVQPSPSGHEIIFAGFTSDKPITSIVLEGNFKDIAIFSFYRSTAVPEPSTWAMMITGFGLAGSALRRRRRAFVAA